jgi:hypothetical protein
MLPVLSSDILWQLAARDTLLAFDFDGTLAPIADDPSSPAMRARTRHLLARVAQLYPCAVISGRPEQDVLRLLCGVTVWYVIGNRGLHPPAAPERATGNVERWQAVLESRLAALDGVLIENKGVSLAVHYRRVRERERARQAIAGPRRCSSAPAPSRERKWSTSSPRRGPTRAAHCSGFATISDARRRSTSGTTGPTKMLSASMA